MASVILALSLLHSMPTRAQAAGSSSSAAMTVADSNPSSQRTGIRDAGPLDGTLCCTGAEPLLFHGDEAIALTGRAGIFKSYDRGASWARSMTGLVAPDGASPFVNAICQAHSNPRILYVLAGVGAAVTPFNGIFYSDDFGKTWTRRGSADTGLGFNLCTVDSLDPHKIYIGGFDSSTFLNAIWRSTDGGLTLQSFGADLPNCALGAPFPRRGILYLLSPSCSVFSTDDGHSFQPLASPPDLMDYDVGPDGNSIFVASEAGTFRSVDRGMTFAPVAGLAQGFNSLNLAFDPTNSSRIYATDGRLYLSVDGGASFALVPATNEVDFPGPIDDISVDQRRSVFVNTPDGIFRSDNADKRFYSVKEGFRASSLNDLAFDAEGRLLVPVIHTRALYRQTHGTEFSAIGKRLGEAGINGTSVAGSPVDSNIILLGTDFAGLLRTDNGGRTWNAATFSDGAASFVSARMSFATVSRVYLAVTTGFYRSDDAGRSFTQLSDLPFGALAVDPRNADVVYAGTYNGGDGLFKSIDGGHSFHDLFQPGAFSAVVIDRRDPKIVIAGQRSGRLIRSLDGGKSFASASAGLRGMGVLGLAQDVQGTWFAWLRGGGLFASDDSGAKWRVVDAGEALQRSGVEAGRAVLIADPHQPGHLYLGNAGVLEVGSP